MNDDKKPKPVDLNEVDLDLMKLKTADMPALLEYAHNVGGFAVAPTEQGQIKGHARQAMMEQTQDQLQMIYQQMKTLAEQVQDIKTRVHISDLIYQADLPFTPVIGKNYFLYEKKMGGQFLSLLSPEDWKEKMEDKTFLAEVKLNADHTWKIVRSTVDLK
jgi:hypothetical protein